MKSKKYVYEVEDDSIEIELSEEEISSLILLLEGLRNSREHIHLDFNDGKRHLLIHHKEDESK